MHRLTLVTQSALYAVPGVLGKAAALVTVPFFSRELAPAGYGLVELAISTAALLQLVVSFSGDISAALIAGRSPVGERRSVFGSYFLASLAISTCLAILLLPFAGMAADVLWSTPGEGLIAATAIVLVPVSTAQAALATVQRLQRRPRIFAYLATIDLLAQTILAVLFVALGLGPIGVLLGFVIGSGIGLVVAILASRRDVVLTLRYASSLVRRGLPFLPSVVAFVVADSGARYLAAHLLGVDEVGILAVAIRIGSVMGLASTAFSLTWGPYALRLQPSVQVGRMHADVLRWFGVLISAATVAVGAVSPELTRFIAGEAFSAASLVLPALLLAAGLAGLGYVLTTAAAILDRSSSAAAAATAGGLLQLAASLLLIPALGLPGLGYAAVAGRLLTLVLLAASVRRLVPMALASVIVLVLAAALTVGVHSLNAHPDATFLARAILAVAAVVVGMAVVLRPPIIGRADGPALDEVPS